MSRSVAVKYIIGIDEVGRGPIAGPLCVGAFLVSHKNQPALLKRIHGIKDSKKLSPAGRISWRDILIDMAKKGACRYCTAFASEKMIDQRGMSFALDYAIGKVLRRLKTNPAVSLVLLDGGIKAPKRFTFQKTIIRGDEKDPLIAAASIVAKVRRDLYMIRLGKRHPEYGFEAHKGYGTKKHYEALKRGGILDIHRISFLKKLHISRSSLCLSGDCEPALFF